MQVMRLFVIEVKKFNFSATLETLENNKIWICRKLSHPYTIMFLCGVGKNIFTASFLNAQEMHSWSTLKENVYIFVYISKKETEI